MAKKGKGYKVDEIKKQRVNEILQEVESAQALKVKPKEIFQRISSYLKQEPSLIIPLIDGLARVPTSQTPQLLHEMIAITKEKEVTKVIKRTLYRLKQKGVQWEEEPPKERPVLRPPEPGEPQGYLGAMDATGSRIIVVARPRPLGGVRVYFSIVNDTEGIQRLELNDLTKKGFREFVENSLTSEEFPVVEAPGEYCVHLVREASDLSQKLGKPLPQGFRDAQKELQDVKWNGSLPLIFRYKKEEEVRNRVRLLKESGNLHKIPPFNAWLLNTEEVQKYAEAIKEAEESRIALTPQQKDARLNSIYMEALRELFPEEKRLRWKRRLEEMAYILWKMGKEREASVALSAAVDLKTPFNPIEPNPFIWTLLVKSIYSLLETHLVEKEKEQKTSLIVTP
ncbi:MAG: hypothetical protein JSW32_00675 [Deltaproteobacteria bacterium]|nr:MAG: hypothetical protein JSW32_00675 [Deltaproteobacteria bacterium]